MAISEQETLFDAPAVATVAPDKRSDYDRLSMVHGELGFIPHSRDELNYATLALDNRDTPGGFARFLNEVLRHQQKSVSNDAPAALRSILAKVKGFADTTRGDKTTLQFIDEELQGFLGTQNFLELDKISSLEGWSLEPSTARGLKLITRHRLAEEALNDEKMVNFAYAETEDAVAEMLAATRVYEAKSALDGALIQADNRHAFWLSCLEQATKHGAVRTIAVQALERLGVTSRV